MSEFLSPSLGAAGSLQLIALRLVAAALFGLAVALIYRRARREPPSSFTTTLVLLTVLIAVVTQVIGDNVARAFSLVGALSIVRFRTVVRDTQDTAYVVFAVAVGMTTGASNVWVAIAGMSVVAAVAFLLRGAPASPERAYALRVRIGLANDADGLVAATLDMYASSTRLLEISTVRQGAATELRYGLVLRRVDFRDPCAR